MDRMKPKPKSQKRKKVRQSTSDPLMQSVKSSARSARAGGSAVTNSLFSFSFFKLALTGGVVLGFTALLFVSGVLGDSTKFNITLNVNPDLEDGLVGHWTFDGADTDWASTTADLLDRSGQENHADIVPTSGTWGDTTKQSTATNVNWFRCMGGDGPSVASTLTGVYIGTNDAGGGTTRLAVYQGGTLADPQAATLVWDAGTVDEASGYVGVTGGSGSLVADEVIWICAKGNDNNFQLYYDTAHDADSDFQSGTGRWQATGLSTDETVAFEADLTGAGTAFGAFWYSLYIDYAPSDPTKFVPGRIGSAIELDGDDDYISTGVYPDSTNVQTMSYWIKFDDVGGNPVSGAHDGSNHRLYTGLYNSGHLFAGFGTAFTNSVVSGIAVGEWHLLTLTGDGSTARLYLDAVEKDSFSYSFSGTSSLDITPGKQNGDEATNMDGTIDDFRLYDRPLSQAEIQRLYQLGATTHINTTLNTNPDLEDGLVGHWTFDGADLINNAVDRSGAGNTGYLTGFTSTTTIPGRIGQALEFDGVDDYVSVSSISAVDKDLSWSVSSWFKSYVMPATRSVADTIWAHSIDSSDRVGLQIFNDEMIAGMYNGSSYFTVKEAPASVNTWYHVVSVYDGSAISLWVDGVESVTVAGDTPNLNAASIFSIGMRTNQQYPFNGVIDDTRVYNRALSTTSIQRLYELGATTHINTTITTDPDLKEGLLVHLTFDGANVNNGVIDSSGNGHDGTLESFPTPLTATPGKIGQALLFDGVDDYVNIPWDASFELSTWTFSAWAKTFSAGEQLLLRLPGGSGWTSSGRFRVSSDGWMIFHCSDGVNSLNAQAQGFTGEEWSHILGTYDGTVVSLWVNGVYAASDSDGACDYAADPTTSGLLVGNVSGVGAFEGAIDEVRFYDHVLSTTTIERLYEFGR